MNYEDAMDFIHECENFGCKPGLDRVYALMYELGNPQDKMNVLHVAGTNGKGSISTMMSYVLKANGYKTGLFLSPGLDSQNERIQINNENISDEEFALCAQAVKEATKIIMEKGYEHPTEFEIFTAMTFYYFEKQKVDFAVIETGMGGRLDATNVVKAPRVVIIANIAYDHMQYLGDTIEEIAAEKAGIIKKGSDVVVYDQTYPKALEVIEKKARELGCKLYKTVQSDISPIRQVTSAQMLWYKKQPTSLNVHTFTLGLIGENQVQNVHCVFNALEALYLQGFELHQTPILLGLKEAKIRYRFEIYSENPFVVLDGAHNEDGIISLKNNLEKFFAGKKPIVFFGMLGDKQVDKCTKIIAQISKEVYTLDVPNPRNMGKEKLCELVKSFNKKIDVKSIESYNEAGEIIKAGRKDALYVFTGSLYFQSEMRNALEKANLLNK